MCSWLVFLKPKTPDNKCGKLRILGSGFSPRRPDPELAKKGRDSTGSGFATLTRRH
jgi:hypothetical protein